MKIIHIYERYKTMKNLQLHMLRVAAVAKMILDNFNVTDLIYDYNQIIEACLLHDMGNIVKFNLKWNEEYLNPEGFEYWNNVRNEFIQRYGTNEHNATIKIAEEVGISIKTIDLIRNVRFSNSKKIFDSRNLNDMICIYSDQRVSPNGVLSLKDRIIEGYERYLQNKGLSVDKVGKEQKILMRSLLNIEKYLFSICKIKPFDINNETIAPIVESLKDYNFIIDKQ